MYILYIFMSLAEDFYPSIVLRERSYHLRFFLRFTINISTLLRTRLHIVYEHLLALKIEVWSWRQRHMLHLAASGNGVAR